MDEATGADLPANLPAIYQAEAERGGSPLQAFLAAAEDAFSKLETIVDTIETWFDPWQTPSGALAGEADFLPWLASWVDLELDDAWSEDKKRRLIQNAAALYRLRGTPRGLRLTLQEFFDIDVEIVEWSWPTGMETGTHSTIGVDSFLAERPDINHCFQLIWRPPSCGVTLDFVRRVRSLIDMEKPAHTRCYFRIDLGKGEPPRPPAMVIGVSSTIGLCCMAKEANDD